MTKPVHTRYVISVLVADRTGVLRDITSAITDLGANIDDIRQTVLEGYFTLLLTATFTEAHTPDAVQAALERNFGSGEAGILVRPHEPVTPPADMPGGQPYILTITGEDRPGILKRATTFLAAKGINIEDWACLPEGATVTYLGELTLPPRLAIRQVQEELRHALAELDLRCNIQHQNIFRATSEIGPIRALLRGNTHA